MFSRLLSLFALFCFPLLAMAAPIPAGLKVKDIKDVPVTADSVLVVQINGLERIKERVTTMMKAVDAGNAKSIGESIESGLKDFIGKDRDLAGLDVKGRFFIAFQNFDVVGGGELPMVVSLPVPDYKTFQKKFLTADERKSFRTAGEGVDEIEFEQLNKTVYLVDDKNGYVIATPNKELAEAYAAKFERLTPKRLDDLAETVLENDIAIYFNMERINNLYAAQIGQVKQFLPLVMQQMQNNLPPEQINTVKAYFDSFIRSFEDSKGFAIGLEARPEGMNFRLDFTIKAKTATAELLKDEKPTALANLMKLPKGYTAYHGSKFGETFVNLGRSLAEFTAAPEDDKTADAIKKYLEASSQSSIEWYTVNQDQNVLQLRTPKDPETIVKTKLKAMSMLTPGAKYTNLVLKDPVKVKEGDQKVGGWTFNRASMVIDFEESVVQKGDPAVKEAAIATMKKTMLEKPQQWFGTDGKSYMEVTAKDWDTAKVLIEKTLADKDTINEDKEAVALRKQLPSETTWMLMMDTSSMVNSIVQGRENLPDTPGIPGASLPAIKMVTAKGTFLGMALTVKPTGVRFDTFVPTAAVKVMMESKKDD
jgi:hypothetical protein